MTLFWVITIAENDFTFVCDPMLSKRHAVVSREGERFRVADVGNEGKGSRHGTRLKNRYLKEKGHLTGEGAALEEGDILIIGKTWVRFLGE